MALKRTKILHTKGRGLAIAALVISIGILVLEFALMYMGISTADLLSFMEGVAGGTSGGDSTTVSTAFLQ